MSLAGVVQTIRSYAVRFRALAAKAASTGQQLRVLVSNTPGTGYTDEEVSRFVLGCAVQAERAASDYGLPSPIVQFLPTGTPKPTAVSGVVDAWLHVVTKIDDPGAQGYHEDGPDGPDGYVSVLHVDVDGFTECLSHEILEAIGNPRVDQIVEGPKGTRWMRELCDAVQATDNAGRVPVDLNDRKPVVMTANYVKPAYWDWQVTSPAGTSFDCLSVLDGPLPAVGPYGYSAVTQPDGTTTDVYGADDQPFALPSEKQHQGARIQAVLAALRQESLAVAITSPAPAA